MREGDLSISIGVAYINRCCVFTQTRYGPVPALPADLNIGLFAWLAGKWRIMWKLCPLCNSDAPKCDSCQVCHNNRSAFHNFTPYIKMLWWNRYVLKVSKICDEFDLTIGGL